MILPYNFTAKWCEMYILGLMSEYIKIYPWYQTRYKYIVIGYMHMCTHTQNQWHYILLSMLQAILLCKPKIEDAGVPAGCQCDKEGNIYVADMRLGILKVTQSGYFTQVVNRVLTSPISPLKFVLGWPTHILSSPFSFFPFVYPFFFPFAYPLFLLGCCIHLPLFLWEGEREERKRKEKRWIKKQWWIGT